MLEKLSAFIAQYLGRVGTGTTAQNKGQCVGLVEAWLAAQGKGPVWGNAVDLMANADPKLYTVVHNAPDNYPPAGAIVCWGASFGGGYGHTAVVIAATAHWLAVFEQNNPVGSPPLVATRQYTGVQGWMIAKA
jgi:surface antigen